MRGRADSLSWETALTEAEISFCAYFVLTGNVKQASLQAGYSAWWGYELLKMPRIQPVLAVNRVVKLLLQFGVFAEKFQIEAGVGNPYQFKKKSMRDC